MRPDDVRETVLVTADHPPDRRLAAYAELGFDGVFVHEVGRDQRRTIELFGAGAPRPGRGIVGREGGRVEGDKATSDLWWNAVIYCLDVELFADGNAGGVGDFQADRPDRLLAGLGVTCLWLMPFYRPRTATTATTSPTTTASACGWAASATSWSCCGRPGSASG